MGVRDDHRMWEGSLPLGVSESTPLFTVSVAAELAGLHAQTLRQYDRLGLVMPQRSAGGGRRYSSRDIAMLREIQRLSQEEGINLAGIRRIMDLTTALEHMQEELRKSRQIVQQHAVQQGNRSRVFTADSQGGIVASAPGRPSGRRVGQGPIGALPVGPTGSHTARIVKG